MSLLALAGSGCVLWPGGSPSHTQGYWAVARPCPSAGSGLSLSCIPTACSLLLRFP